MVSKAWSAQTPIEEGMSPSSAYDVTSGLIFYSTVIKSDRPYIDVDAGDVLI